MRKARFYLVVIFEPTNDFDGFILFKDTATYDGLDSIRLYTERRRSGGQTSRSPTTAKTGSTPAGV
jgi:hypothetical protein